MKINETLQNNLFKIKTKSALKDFIRITKIKI